MFKLFGLVVMTRKERTNEVLKNNEALRLRLEQAEKKNSEIKFGEF